MQWIDSHCHLDFNVFDKNREKVLHDCFDSGMQLILVPGTQADRWPGLIELARTDKRIKLALGLHPYFLAEESLDSLDQLRHLLIDNEQVVAIGETGLDAMITGVPMATQELFFKRQLEIAEAFHLPLVLHVRKCHDKVVKLLKQYQLNGGVIHAFSGSQQQAEAYLKQGFKLGFGGAITYDRANKLRNTFKALPLECILVETDAPDMQPAFSRDQPNTPLNVPKYLQLMADLRQMDVDTLALASVANFHQTFNC